MGPGSGMGHTALSSRQRSPEAYCRPWICVRNVFSPALCPGLPVHLTGDTAALHPGALRQVPASQPQIPRQCLSQAFPIFKDSHCRLRTPLSGLQNHFMFQVRPSENRHIGALRTMSIGYFSEYKKKKIGFLKQ